MEYIIPVEVMPKPRKKLRRVNSAQSLWCLFHHSSHQQTRLLCDLV